ncbi:DUF3592 domain-containing protein [Stigmatella sp. ncwal1]|uniref:DUF3592 domain-containing protein n=1 Tax=Stigmatella ashevillensis TaxID=2995309 RepID=A0ABT5DB29_9BACT|nr:DUF3592 domain-containing protein [Stigmatella ashevillena]MDC0710864.1 DUF3592 domain-containing protein [Stigmatella ashevillena]
MRLLWGFIHLLCALLAAVGTVLLVVGLKEVWRASRTRRWPTAPGKVISTEELQHLRRAPPEEGGGTRLLYEALVHYEYTVGRVLIGSTRVRVSPTATSSEARSQAILARYPPGQEIRVFYNPGDPTESVLDPGAHPLDFIRVGVGGALVFMAVAAQLIVRWFAARL